MKESVKSQLSTDHRNVARLLAVLGDQLDKVEQAENANFDLMTDVMHYMTTYPDQVHHRLEDLLYQTLYAQRSEFRPMLDRMFEEHTALADKGGALYRVLEGVVDGRMVERTELVGSGRAYVDLLRNHMIYENEQVFPIADDQLDAASWTDVATRFAAQRDPVFGDVQDEQFAVLLAHIKDEAQAS